MNVSSQRRPVTSAHLSIVAPTGGGAADGRGLAAVESLMGMGVPGRLAVAAALSALVWSAIAFGLA